MKVTFDLDPDLYRSLKVEAARTDLTVRDAVAEAIAAWLARREDDEDRASAAAALEEYQRDGGTAAAAFFEHLAAEAKASYGPGGLMPGVPYRVDLSPAAGRQLRRMPPGDAARLRGPILALGIEPPPPGATRLVATDWWRLRIGDMRLVYAIDDEKRLVVILRAARRNARTNRRP